MSELKVNVLKAVNKVTKKMVVTKNDEWQYKCTVILHQPKRPGKKTL